MSNTLLHAKKYIANGWSVFPLKPGTKDEPAVKWGEYRERYATNDELEKWFATTNNNIGIVTGKLSNLTVLDCDGSAGIEQAGRLGLSSRVAVFTQSGGKHIYYRSSGETNVRTSKDHQGLDSRGEGGYVAAPPSRVGVKQYRWVGGIIPSASLLTAWPEGLLATKPKEGVTVPLSQGSEPWIIKALAGVGSGERHQTLIRLACYLIPRHHYDIVKQNLIDWNLKNQPPMAEAELVKQLDDVVSRFKKGVYVSKFKQPVAQPEVKDETLDVSSASESKAYFLAQLQEQPIAIPELATGFTTLDKVTYGVKRGSLFTIGARPGTGKTSLACNITANLCKTGRRVLYFSTEMSREELFNKFAASEGDIPAGRFEDKSFTQSDRDKLVQFTSRFEQYDLHVVRLFRPDIKSVREGIAKYNPDVVVFDHIQHIETGANEYAAISNFTKSLKEIAVTSNVGIIVASQLSRNAVFNDVIPEMHHLKGCGTIEEESSVVLLMHDDTKKDDRAILIRVAKNRFGKMGDATLMFRSDITKFEDMGVPVS